ncbi:trehalose-phosphatase [Halococcus saccharolyticus]|uniref:Trehalose 6-phosphate phosphatase n=1 Tax=Halococcus saccharolyticus DSM 5350 TaxID=1227455 RepID=M0MKP7_9EURY|nr:trehalose-phosphatase [Halococcus saccharolyticus]EMA46241.1 trehalose-phosphatase [Halococcus saccharolyticus DSM 5350]
MAGESTGGDAGTGSDGETGSDGRRAGADGPDRPPALFDETGEPLAAVADRLATADGLFFCTDFDGTLSAIDEDPDAPEIAPDNREALRELRDHDRVRVAVISGRELADLRPRVGIEGIAYAGNHGLEVFRDGATTVHPVAKKRQRDLERIVADLEDRLADTDCFVEDKSVSATIHYRAAPERAEAVHTAVEETVERIAPSGFERSVGKEIVELTPAVAWDKGAALSLLTAEQDDWLPVYVGDDTTDEAAFRELGERGVGIHVGAGEETAADYRIDNPPAVERLLDWFHTEGLAALDRSSSA